MSRVLMIGAGGVATVAAFKIAQNADVFTEFMIASRRKQKCDAIVEAIHQKGYKLPIQTAQVDADDVEQLKTLFNSQSNPSDKSTLTMEELREASRRGLIDKKVYAMGGMNLDNISVAKELGFGGVVICGDLWNRFDIHNELDYKALISHFEKLRKAVE